MPDLRITAETEQLVTSVADDDLFETVDVSDTSMAATGTNKKIKKSNLQASLGYTDLATLVAVQGAKQAAQDIASTGYYVAAPANAFGGGLVTASGTLGFVTVAAGTDYMGDTELVYAQLTSQQGTRKNVTTTVAAGSNGVNTNTFVGSQSLTVASTTSFPSSGVISINRGGTILTVAYTAKDATHFLNCTSVVGWPTGVLVTADSVAQVNCDVTNPSWAWIELDSSGVCQFNQGVAAATPIVPTNTASRVPHALLYLPALANNTNALTIDTLVGTSNGKAKLIDPRCVRKSHARVLWTESGAAILTNPTALTSVLAAPITIPGNSINIGDLIEVDCELRILNNTGASTVRTVLALNAVNIWDVTSASLASNANARYLTFHAKIQFKVIGASAQTYPRIFQSINAASASSAGTSASADWANGGGFWSTIPTDADFTIDFSVLFGTSSAGATIALRHFSVSKIPA